jgi:hypothetical protein
MAADLQGPLDDFLGRTREIRAIIVAVESAAKSPAALTTSRAGVNLSGIDLKTGNTANAMSLVFLASSFEEFIREEIGQCAGYMAERYAHLSPEVRHGVRNAYWSASLDRLRYFSSILTKKKPKIPDAAIMSNVRVLLDAIQGFVINDNAAHLDRTLLAQHSNNFRPHVVNELACRLGVTDLLGNAAVSRKIKNYFGVSKKADAAERLRAKLNDFYDRRNETVHSLNGATGYAVEVIFDYIELLEACAESIRNVFAKELASW